MIKQNPFSNRGNTRFTNKFTNRNVGTIRKTQLITSFSIGSIVDFVNDTVIICGTDDWKVEDCKKIHHRGLEALTNKKYFLSPKVSSSNLTYAKSQDIPSYTFPKNLYCPRCKKIFHADMLGNTNKCPHCKNSKLTASRFVLVCEKGHVTDFPYSIWVHKGEDCESRIKYPTMEMYSIDNKTGIDNIIIQCTECKKNRRISSAFGQMALHGQSIFCTGDYVHLNKKSTHSCDCIPQLKLRSSSSIHFPYVISALSIPPYTNRLLLIIEDLYNDILSNLDDNISLSIIKSKVSNFSDEEILKTLKYVKFLHSSDYKPTQESIYYDEYIALSNETLDNNNNEFNSSFVKVPERYSKQIESITAIDTLTETMVLYGFTRLKPSNSMYDENLVPLSSKPLDYLPAVKLFGEGIFIKFKKDALLDWNKKVSSRYDSMAKNLEKSFMENKKFSSIYVLLHTFAHLFIRQISNECGYSVASLKEKIYSTFTDDTFTNHVEMYGVLIYLSSSDSDGSLGGLVRIAKDTSQLENIINNTINSAMWCSSDPLCINSKSQGVENLNFASCYSCTLLPETSCETGNILLDRYSLIGDLNKHDGFFYNMLST